MVARLLPIQPNLLILSDLSPMILVSLKSSLRRKWDIRVVEIQHRRCTNSWWKLDISGKVVKTTSRFPLSSSGSCSSKTLKYVSMTAVRSRTYSRSDSQRSFKAYLRKAKDLRMSTSDSDNQLEAAFVLQSFL